MPNAIIKLLAVFALAAPLALAGCQGAGDEHPGESTSEHPESSSGSTSEHPSSKRSEHPGS